MQMAAGVAEHDPRRRLARGGQNGNRDRLPWRQTVSNRSTGTFSFMPCSVVTATWRPSGSSM